MIREDSRVQSARERFWREARARARVSHPNVCQLFDVGEDGGDLYIAMELLEGEPLSARLERGALPMTEAGQVTENLAKAADAFHRALEINPDLSIALNLRANLEVEMGSGCETTVELLNRVRLHPNDPELYAGLVHSTRYCGLLEASVAADRMAHRLDPSVPTSVRYTYWMQGEFEKAIAGDLQDYQFSSSATL